MPTSLSVSSPNVVTLDVKHRSSQFVYPVVAGSGWQGGFVSTKVEGPKDEQELKEEQERIAREEHERIEREGAGEETEGSVSHRGEELIVHASAIGPPIPSNSKATASQKTGTPAHVFKFSECRWGGISTDFPPGQDRTLVEIIGSCLREESDIQLWAGMTVRGYFHYITGSWVWVDEHPDNQLECVKWGPHKPAKVNCFAKPWKTKESLTVRGDYRMHSQFSDLMSECITIYGHLNSTIPYKVPEESIISLVGAYDYFEPCDWP